MRKLVISSLFAFMLAAASCGGGGGNGQPQPQPSEFSALAAADGAVRVSAAPGSVDPGSEVTVSSGGSGSGTAAADGSVSFDAQLNAASQLGQFVISYLRNSSMQQATATVIEQASLVSLNALATGSGPNDLLYSGGSLYVANSLDNTVTRHDSSGTQQAVATLAEFSSPSHLTADLTHLYVVANGSNQVIRMGLFQLEFNQTSDVFQLGDLQAAFIGPASPAVFDNRLFVPRSQVLEFAEFGSGDPTTYGPGLFTEVEYRSVAPTGQDIQCVGRNPQFCAYNPARNLLVVVSGGELNFGADFTPYVSTDSYLEFYRLSSQLELIDSLNMGRIGAGAIAFSSDGGTAYLGNSISGSLYKVDIAGRRILRGEDNPIVLTEAFTYISDVEISQNGRYVLATSFNTDELYILPTASDIPGDGPFPGPLDMSQGEFLAGAAAVELDGLGNAWVLNGLANSVNRVSLLP